MAGISFVVAAAFRCIAGFTEFSGMAYLASLTDQRYRLQKLMDPPSMSHCSMDRPPLTDRHWKTVERQLKEVHHFDVDKVLGEGGFPTAHGVETWRDM